MRKAIVISIMAAAVLCGCQNEELSVLNSDSKSFIATIDDSFSGAETKTSLDNQGNVLWKQGDQLSIFAGSTINEQWQVTDASDGKTAAELNKISGAGFNAGGEIDNNVALYPYSSVNTIAKSEGNYVIGIVLPSTQNYAEASFGNGAFPMAAVTSSTTDMNLKFKNILGGLKLQLKGTATIASISISGNNNEILCGAANVTASVSGKPSISLTDGSAKTVTLNCGDGVQLDADAATSFVIALPPMTMTGGFTVTVTDTDGKQMEIKTTKSQTIARSSLLKMPEVEYIGAPAKPLAVDLGLSFKWASFNVGASRPEEYGKYYQWAGIEDVSYGIYLDWSNCPYHSGSGAGTGWTKYNSSGGYGTVDNLSVLEPSDDIASVSLGGYWRMPTMSEWAELTNTNNCSWTWTTLNGVNGYKVQSKIPGFTDNWIFLPAAGYRIYGEKNCVGEVGAYWSSSRYPTYAPNQAYELSFSQNNVSIVEDYRCEGRSVRPIWGEVISVTSISLNTSAISLMRNESATLVATINPVDATNKSISWESSDNNIVKVSPAGVITAVSIGSAIITAKTNDGGYKAKCNVTVTQEYIDLGLPSGILWSTCNRGATEPWYTGYFFTDSFSTGYLKDNVEADDEGDYYWCDWVPAPSYDDGGRVPTRNEFEELISSTNTSIEYKSSYDGHSVPGLLITSKTNGKSIFIPESGTGNGSMFFYGLGMYWAGSSYCLRFGADAPTPAPNKPDFYSVDSNRHATIRPVKER